MKMCQMNVGEKFHAYSSWYWTHLQCLKWIRCRHLASLMLVLLTLATTRCWHMHWQTHLPMSLKWAMPSNVVANLLMSMQEPMEMANARMGDATIPIIFLVHSPLYIVMEKGLQRPNDRLTSHTTFTFGQHYSTMTKDSLCIFNSFFKHLVFFKSARYAVQLVFKLGKRTLYKIRKLSGHWLRTIY